MLLLSLSFSLVLIKIPESFSPSLSVSRSFFHSLSLSVFAVFFFFLLFFLFFFSLCTQCHTVIKRSMLQLLKRSLTIESTLAIYDIFIQVICTKWKIHVSACRLPRDEHEFAYMQRTPMVKLVRENLLPFSFLFFLFFQGKFRSFGKTMYLKTIS